MNTTLRRIGKIALYAAAVAAVPLIDAVGTGTYKLRGLEKSNPLAPTSGTAPARYYVNKPIAVVIAGNRGTEVTDFIPPYALLAASGEYNVYVVTPEERAAVMNNGSMAEVGLGVLPHYSFSGFDRKFARAPDLIVIPYLPGFTPEKDAATVSWIRAHAGPNTRLLSICQGAEILAATGLLNGKRATANAGAIAMLRERYPLVKWQRDVRYVLDGNVGSSARLSAGIDATLATIGQMAGRAAALRTAQVTGYVRTDYLDDPRASDRLDLRFVLDLLLLNPRQRLVGVELSNGVDEIALAAALEMIGSSLDRSATFTKATQPVTSKRGLVLVSAQAQGHFDRVVALPVGDHFGYDAVLRAEAERSTATRALSSARALNYPAEQLELSANAWDWGWWKVMVEAVVGFAIVWWLAWRRQRQLSLVAVAAPSSVEGVLEGQAFILGSKPLPYGLARAFQRRLEQRACADGIVKIRVDDLREVDFR